VKRTPVRGVKENLKPCAYKLWEGYALGALCLWGMPDCVLIASRAGELSLAARLSRQVEPKRKRVRKGVLVAGGRPEAVRSSHGQGEVRVTPDGGPNLLVLKNHWMSCG
jgi:hypothetical protein